MKFSALYGTQKFFTVFITARHWTLSWARWTLITLYYPLTTDTMQYMLYIGSWIPIPESVHVNFC
jgi:hypothetical protein